MFLVNSGIRKIYTERFLIYRMATNARQRTQGDATSPLNVRPKDSYQRVQYSVAQHTPKEGQLASLP